MVELPPRVSVIPDGGDFAEGHPAHSLPGGAVRKVDAVDAVTDDCKYPHEREER